MNKSTATLTSALILSFMVTGAALAQSTTDPAALAFPTSPNQLGGDGNMGVGGEGGEGGAGGAGGIYTQPDLIHYRPEDPSPGKPGKPGEPGGKGGTGGSGEWVFQNMAPGSVFSNQGTIRLGGEAGSGGTDGRDGLLSGGRGGDGGAVFRSGKDGAETVPDIWPDEQEGGKGGAWLGGKGENGIFGGGGGGGADSGIERSTGVGGKGGKGIDGSGGVGGTGLPGNQETSVTTNSATSTGTVQIGGNGGQGGPGGLGGSGGGGGGGAGSATFLLVFPTGPTLGARGGDPGVGGSGGPGGDGGNGTIEVRNAGIFVNDSGGKIFIGRDAAGEDGPLPGQGTVNVRMGGTLSNRNQIDINENGALNILGGTVSNDLGATISNKGAIANNGTFINNGQVNTALGIFANFGAYTGTGTYLGTFVNNGVVAPGNSIGTMMIDGDFVNTVALEVEIAGFGSGMHDFLDVSGAASFLEGSLISFLPWEDYGFEDIAPQETKSLEFFHAAGGITTFLSAIAFGEGFLPDGFAFNVLNDGNSLFLEVTNNVPPVPLPPAIWLFISAILGFGLIARGKRS